MLFSEVLTVVEGVTESLPQFSLQLYTFLWNVKKGDTARFLGFIPYRTFIAVSGTLSAMSFLKAIWNFFTDYKNIMELLVPPVVQALREDGTLPKTFDPYNRDSVLAAMEEDLSVLTSVSLTSLGADKDFFLAAVRQNGRALEYAPKKLKADKDVVLAAVHQDWHALEYASNDLKADNEAVLAAVQQDWHALKYASYDLKGDKEIVLAAVQQKGLAFQYASNDLKADKEVVLVAVRQDGRALQYASKDLNADTDVRRAAGFATSNLKKS